MNANRLVSLLALLYVVGFCLLFVYEESIVFGLTPMILAVTSISTWTITGQPKNAKFWLLLGLIAVLGFVAEYIGVTTGWLFGTYQYESTLGIKLFNTPVFIGVLWSFVAWTMFVLTRRINPMVNRLIISGLGAVIFDVILESFAEKSLLWSWSNGHPSAYNYVCWFLLTVIFVYLLEISRLKTRQQAFAAKVIIVEVIFCLSVILK